jgi:glycosyltransferase involved in cell wall biosynthesis
MNFLFVHQNMPGQFGRLAERLAADPANRVVFLTREERKAPRGCVGARYSLSRPPSPETHQYLRPFEDAVLHGQAVARACLDLARRGFVPDLVIAHPGWGEALYVKDALPGVKLVSYCEFFYHAAGADVGFDPAETVDTDVAARLRTRNAHLMLSLDACDRGVSATHWQKSVHPAEWHAKIEVIHDGIDIARAAPDPEARFTLPGTGEVLTPANAVVTYIARHLEPYRGFPTFARSLPAILDALPCAQVVIAGGDGVSYGRAPRDGRTWRATMLDEVKLGGAAERVHFVGTLPYADYLRLLQVSTAHVYLTVPFVLSWSAMEALATGCVVIGSRTPPVEEVIEDGVNGLLVDFFASDQVAARVIEAVSRRHEFESLRSAARAGILAGGYDLATCQQRQLDLLFRMTGRNPLPSATAKEAAA